MNRLLSVIVIVVVLVVASASGSVAGKKRIKPSDLKPRLSDSVYFQDDGGVRSGNNAPVRFWAEVKLPVGKTITKLAYYHSGFSGATEPAHGTYVSLWEKKFGAFYSLDPLMKVGSSEYGLGMRTVTTTLEPYENGKIKNGYTYSLLVTSDNENSWIHGIEITYK